MPALYAIAQHPAIAAVRSQSRASETVFAYLDDVYVVAIPERTSGRAVANPHLERTWGGAC